MLSRRNIFRFLNGNKEKPPGICEVLGGKIHNPGYCEREGNYGPYWSTSLSHSSLQRVVEDVHPLASQVASMGEQLVYKPHQLLIRHDEPYREWCFNVLTALIQQADNVLDTGNGKTQDA